MALALEDPAAAPFVCCPDGLFASQVPSGEYPTSAIIVQILAWVLILLGGVLNKLQPGFVRPKGILGSFYHKVCRAASRRAAPCRAMPQRATYPAPTVLRSVAPPQPPPRPVPRRTTPCV